MINGMMTRVFLTTVFGLVIVIVLYLVSPAFGLGSSDIEDRDYAPSAPHRKLEMERFRTYLTSSESSSKCEPVAANYNVTLPFDFGPHPLQSYEYWWYFGVLFESPEEKRAHRPRFGYLLGVNRCSVQCVSLENETYNGAFIWTDYNTQTTSRNMVLWEQGDPSEMLFSTSLNRFGASLRATPNRLSGSIGNIHIDLEVMPVSPWFHLQNPSSDGIHLFQVQTTMGVIYPVRSLSMDDSPMRHRDNDSSSRKTYVGYNFVDHYWANNACFQLSRAKWTWLFVTVFAKDKDFDWNTYLSTTPSLQYVHQSDLDLTSWWGQSSLRSSIPTFSADNQRDRDDHHMDSLTILMHQPQHMEQVLYVFPSLSSIVNLNPESLMTLSHGFKILNFSCIPIQWWISPRSLSLYPTHHEIRVPSLNLRLTIDPLVEDNELYFLGRPFYYEGPSTITGTCGNASLHGYGITELMGFSSL